MKKDSSDMKLELSPWLNSEFLENMSDLRNRIEEELHGLYIYVLF
jgi:hypothetical protein